MPNPRDWLKPPRSERVVKRGEDLFLPGTDSWIVNMKPLKLLGALALLLGTRSY